MRKPYFLIFISAVALSACSTPSGDPQPALKKSAQADTGSQITRSGQRSFIKGRYKEAARSYHAVLQENPYAHEARLGLGESYLKLGETAEAITHFEELLPLPEYKAAALQGIGLASLQHGNFIKAEEALLSAVSTDLTLWRAWSGLARLYDAKEDWVLADEAYQNALLHTDRPEVVYNNMGISLMTQEKFADAAKAFSEALAHKPDLEIAKTNQKLALALDERYDEATLVEKGNSEAQALNNAGYAAMLRKDYDEAEKLFMKAIEVHPSFYRPAYDNLQVLYHLKGKRS